MKTISKLILVLLLAPLASMAQFEGKMTMTIKVTTEDPEMQQAAQYMPTEMIIFTKGSKSRIETNTMMGSTIILSDTLAKVGYVCMDMMGNKIAMAMPYDEMESEEAVSDMQIKYLNETKMVAGYKCKKAIITMKVENQEVLQTVWYCEEIQNTNRDMYKLKGMPMEYEMDMEGMNVSYVVSNVSKEKIADTMFDVPAGYTVTTQDDLNNLFPAMEPGEDD
jgi:hypothetical protein